MSIFTAIFVKQVASELYMIDFIVIVLALFLYLFLQSSENTVDRECRIFNKKAFVEEVEKYIRQKQPFTIIGLDIDNFNRINERYSYTIGIAFLRKVAESIDHIAPDMTYRLDGDMFAVLFPQKGIFKKSVEIQRIIRML